MITFAMPALGSDMDEGTLTEWLVKKGDSVTRGQIVAVVETTKAAVEIECWQEGVVDELLVQPGETVQIGTPIARLIDGSGIDSGTAEVIHAQADSSMPIRRSHPPRSQPAPSPDGVRRQWISPAARRLAAAKGVDLDTLAGTGLHGSITLDDVERASADGELAASRSPTLKADMRRSIAAAMTRSKREIPHYYLEDQVVMQTAIDWLRQYNAQRSVTDRILAAVLQLKAVALAVQRYSEFNGFWRDDSFVPATSVHVGVAISLRSGGLVAPALHDVPNKGLDILMTEFADLVRRARAGSLRSSEMSDPTITITNLGDDGVQTVFGVIYPPQVALVGFGKIARKVCPVDDEIRIVNSMQITLAGDHRASDGHRGALFLAEINKFLQQPEVLLK
jgi:pyruvate dehydrogenase E2 component (dihydrolipoamide acetyltransferase)